MLLSLLEAIVSAQIGTMGVLDATYPAKKVVNRYDRLIVLPKTDPVQRFPAERLGPEAKLAAYPRFLSG
jgi:hypothetical protein